MVEKFDVLVVGAGFAGLSAAIYCARFNLKTLIVGNVWGGLIITTHVVENYPGYKSLSGYDLMQKFKEHVEYYNIPFWEDQIESIEKKREGKFFAKTMEGKEIEAKTLILATGTTRKNLNVPGEKEFENRGVSYCATCDAFLFKGKDVVVVGGSDSAAKEALLLSEHAKSVTVLVRSSFHPEPINGTRIAQRKNIKVLIGVEVKEIAGKEKVEKVILKNGKELIVQGVFIEVGHNPQTELAQGLGVNINEKKEIPIDRYSRTSTEGVFAAGDCVDTEWKQGIVSAAEGAHAANSVYNYLNEKGLLVKRNGK
ncbi:MAG: FAD-dependent oxidoreductase [Candidatus Diapherotrites archaeon]|nr:FAD-dependent oxidoreductase [Candidatus Diapherotrites archaeon]